MKKLTLVLGAALVLEPIYDATGEWIKLISVLEVQVKALEQTEETRAAQKTCLAALGRSGTRELGRTGSDRA